MNRNSSALQQGERDGEYTIVADKSKSKSKKQASRCCIIAFIICMAKLHAKKVLFAFLVAPQA